MRSVVFIDTSVLCNLLPVPGRDQLRDLVLQEMRDMIERDVVMILPMTTVIETGNFIAQLNDGRERRQCAERLSAILESVISGSTPWHLHSVEWGREFLVDLRNGGGTDVSLVEHAVNQLGGGDLCILTERLHYSRRSTLERVWIWTKDKGLDSYNDPFVFLW